MNSCFDISRCMKDFKVYVYPTDVQDKPTNMYKAFLSVLQDSNYYTTNPREACLFVPSIDTLDRDPLSSHYNKHLPNKLKGLAHWNNGRNHLLFNFYSGSFPDYTDQLDFEQGEAIVAMASFSSSRYRTGFDVSLPLLHQDHQRWGKDWTSKTDMFPVHKRYLLSFKGKRYLWGHGSVTRNSLYHVHNGRDIVILTTCKHGKHWNKFRDSRCDGDNELFEK